MASDVEESDSGAVVDAGQWMRDGELLGLGAGERVGPNGLPVEKAVDALSNTRRRQLIDAIALSDDGVELTDVAEWIAAIEREQEGRESDGGDGDAEDRRRVFISLTQNHIPRLIDYGIVTDTDRVRAGETFDDVQNALAGLRLGMGLGLTREEVSDDE